MSPILFNLFIEPLLDWLARTEPTMAMVLAYADDMCLFSTSHSTLQTMTSRMQLFLHSNGLELGVSADKSKTVYMTTDTDHTRQICLRKVSTVRENNQLTLRLHDTTFNLPKLTGKESYKYLGVWWNVENDNSAHLARAKAKLHFMCRNLQRAKFTTLQTVKIFNQVITPAVTFGFEVIRPPQSVIENWNWIVRKLINKKIGIHWNSTTELHYLPQRHLGLGLLDLNRRLTTAKVTGIVHRGLNSADLDVSRASEARYLSSPEKKTQITHTPELYVTHNPAYLRPLDSLTNIFEPHDPAIHALMKRNIHNTGQLIDENGEITPQLRNIPELRNIISRIVVREGEYRVDPRILFRIRHQARYRVTNNETCNIFTDGSLQTHNGTTHAGFGVYVPGNLQLHRAVRTADNTGIFDNELMAVAAGITANCTNLKIYLDNQAVISHIRKLEQSGHIPRSTSNASREATEMILDTLAFRRQQNAQTSLHHVLSHSDDGTLPKAEQKRRANIMTARYGAHAPGIIAGNKHADKLAKEGALKPLQHLTQVTRSLPRFVITDRSGKMIDNPSIYINNTYNEQYLKALREEKRPPIAPGMPE